MEKLKETKERLEARFYPYKFDVFNYDVGGKNEIVLLNVHMDLNGVNLSKHVFYPWSRTWDHIFQMISLDVDEFEQLENMGF
jgi:hypothetical protein